MSRQQAQQNYATANAAEGGVYRELRQTFPAAAAGNDTSDRSSAQVSQELTDALVRAGFTKDRVQTHFQLRAILEEMWSRWGFTFSGNFTEGWGYNLYSVSGRPGFDSSVTYRYTLPGVTIHAKECGCPDKTQLTYEILKGGTVRLSDEAMPILWSTGVEEGMHQSYVLNKRSCVVMQRSSANPEVHFVKSAQCCPHWRRQLSRRWPLPDDWLEAVSREQLYIRPRPPAAERAVRNQFEVELDFSELERQAFALLSDQEGQLYMSLKFALLVALPQRLGDGRQPLDERHCRHLLLHSLALQRGRADCLADSLLASLQLLDELLHSVKDKRSAMPNFFCPSLRLRLPEDGVDKPKLSALLAHLRKKENLLPVLRQYAGRLRPAAASFVFRPLLLTIAGCGAERRRVRTLADYPAVGFGLYRAIDLLLESRQPTHEEKEEFEATLADLRPVATTAAACLEALLILKLGQGPGLAQQMLARVGNIAVSDSFEFNTNALPAALLKRDCAWLFRGKFVKLEPAAGAGQQRTEPAGTEFLSNWPLVRNLFFPTAGRFPSTSSPTVRFDYSLRVNFVALLRALQSQLSNEWGTALPANAQPQAEARTEAQPEAQELAVRAALEKRQTVESLLPMYQQLLQSVAPFHAQRGSAEWLWVQCARLRLLGLWVRRLLLAYSWQQEQLHDCARLRGFAQADAENFRSVSDMLPRLLWLGRRAEAKYWLRAFLNTELQETFPQKGESGYLVQQLYNDFWQPQL